MTALPKFLIASDADRAGWRSQPMSKEFLEMLDWEEARVADSVLDMVRQHKAADAERLDGKLEAIQELRALIWHRAPIATTEQDDPFIDPATRPSTLVERSK